MKRAILLAAVLQAIVAGNAAAGRLTPRTAIQRQYKRWAAAALSNDVQGVLAILAPDYTLTTYGGQVIKLRAYAVSLRKRKASGKKPTAYATAIESVRLSASKALVVSLEVSTTLTPDPVTNKLRKLVHTHRYLDTWTRIAGRWRLESTVTQLESTTVR